MPLYEPEAAVLQEMARRIIGGYSFKDVAWWANQQGYRTTTGKEFLPVTIRNMLQKPRYAGLREYDGVIYHGTWEPVFDAATWDSLQLAMKLKREAHQVGIQPRRFLLTGLAFCGKCGTPLNGATRQDRASAPKRRIYHCRTQGDAHREYGCGGVRRNADALEDWIKEAVIYRLDTPVLGELLPQGDDNDAELRQLLEERTAQQQRLDGLAEDYSTGLLSREQLAKANVAGQNHLAALNQRIDELHRSRQAVNILPTGQTVRQAWDDCDSDTWRRSLLKLLIERIDVHPG